MLSLILFILILGAIVAVHEFGHFFFAENTVSAVAIPYFFASSFFARIIP